MYGALSKQEHQGLYLKHVEPGTSIGSYNAATYTCPVYASLLSFLLAVDPIDQRLLCFSYGSGCAASMYGL